MKYFYLFALGMLTANIACGFLKGSKKPLQNRSDSFLVIGHRGDPTHFPENSIESFISAIKKGANAIEMDVVVSGDKKIVVSHEPYMAARYVLTPTGKPIPKSEQLDHNLYVMPYNHIRRYDTGSKYDPQFPGQAKFSTYKPLLEEVIDSVDHFTKSHSLNPVTYLIEVKSQPRHYETYQPVPVEFARLIQQVIKEKDIAGRVVVKSFDPAFLNAFHKLEPEITTSFLVNKKGIHRNLDRLEFTPDIYSPRFRLITKPIVDSLHFLGIEVIPWTVNRKSQLRTMIRCGVDGIITDYPERAVKIVK